MFNVQLLALMTFQADTVTMNLADTEQLSTDQPDIRRQQNNLLLCLMFVGVLIFDYCKSQPSFDQSPALN